MILPRRIRTIYVKELIDILRDRRTLIAMIVVPIVLYPLLMVGSIQAVTYQMGELDEEELRVGVLSEEQGGLFGNLITRDAEALERHRAELEAAGEPTDDLPAAILKASYRAYESEEALQAAIRNREVRVGLIFLDDRSPLESGTRVEVKILRDNEEVRSALAARRVQEMVARTNERIQRDVLRRAHLPEDFVEPYAVIEVDLSAPQSVLGQIVPLILILMTITGAIYPAIDLTAGERERGTLETLMVCPVSVMELIVGKFMVVTTVAVMGAALNLASVTATVYLGGFKSIIAASGGTVPIGRMVYILLALIPFAVLMSALMIAVCSYARTFKEAQNYVTPLILAVLIPGGLAAFPTTDLAGMMLVMPVGNMVLLARELLLGGAVPAWKTLLVLASTTLYAAAAVGIAANVFGRESVVFADTESLRTTFARRLIRPRTTPTLTMSLMLTALLFPTWFFLQSWLSPREGGDATGLLYGSAVWMPVVFVLLPTAVLLYWKVDVASSISLRVPAARYVLAAVLIGLSSWVPAHELSVLQEALFGMPQALLESAKAMEKALQQMPPAHVLLILAVLPALCEEWLFRGYLLSGLSAGGRKWTAILVSAVVFAIFHFMLFKFPVTAGLGIVLALLCVQSRSILPGMIAHLLHNGMGAMTIVVPGWYERLGISSDDMTAHLPPGVLVAGLVVFVLGLALVIRPAATAPSRLVAQSVPN